MKFNKNLFAVLAAITTVVATTMANSACLWFMYQPEEPKSLREE